MLAIEFHPETLPVVEEENNDIASMKSTEESKFFIIFQVFCFVHPIFRFWFLVTFGDEVTKILKYYIIFV